MTAMNNTNVKIHELTTQAIEEIRLHLKEHGDIEKIELYEKHTTAYFDDADNAVSADYSIIQLGDNGSIFVMLTDEHWLLENDLTTNHVLDIFNIINDGHGTYPKSVDR